MLEKIKNFYAFTGVTLLSVGILLAFANFVAGLFVKDPAVAMADSAAALNASAAAQKRQREAIVEQFIQRHGVATLRNAYPGMSDQTIRQLLVETGVVGNRYYPYVEFIQAPYVAPDMVSSPVGYRIIGRDQASWPPPRSGKTVFVFGGSTTLGSGVMNEQTIPAYLQKWLRANFGNDVNVYNFGTGSHYSTQEVLFFFDWLRKGVRPDLAIFVDGLNDHYFTDDRSSLSTFLEQAYDRQIVNAGREATAVEGPWRRIGEAALSLPLARSIVREKAFAGSVVTSQSEDTAAKADRPTPPTPEQLATSVLDRYIINIKTAAGMGTANGVPTFFVWQPVPLYKLDPTTHPFEIEPKHQLHRIGYPIMFERFKSHALPSNFAWCADVQEGLHEMLYVDQVHYRPALAQLVAQCITQNLASSDIIDRLGWKRTSATLVTPALDDDFEARPLNDTLKLIDVVTQQPWRVGATAIKYDAQPDAMAPASYDVTLTSSGGVAEHYLSIPANFFDGKEYIISLQARAERAPGFRLQAWDGNAHPDGVIADVVFAGDAVTVNKSNIVDVAEGHVVKQGDWYDVTLHVKLPERLSSVIVQLRGKDGGNSFAPDGAPLTIRNFEIHSVSSNG
ncbi:MAG TPA: SGNH/GDSL hydrolase family protein [Bradyrhizobium sp.]|nr:SGNH/GDSL hydrolase family protein [Bradyrhizobium sp.]